MKKHYSTLFLSISCLLSITAFAQQKKPPVPQKKIAPAKNDSVKITITNLRALNSTFSDYDPVISADGLVLMFASRRPVTEKEIAKKKESLEHIYESDFNTKTKKWSAPKILPSTINPEDRMDCPLALSNDGQQLFIYRDDNKKNGD